MIHLEKVNPLNDEHSFIKLVDYVGDELSIVNAARVSFHNESEYEETPTELSERIVDYTDKDENNNPKVKWANTLKTLSERDRGLVNFLLKNKHGSPFEQGFISQWHIRLPIFVMRELVRHRIGFSVNEESGRYTKLRPDFFIPDHIRTQEGKPGAYTFEVSDDKQDTEMFQNILTQHSEQGYRYYEWALVNGVAKEQARLFLGLNLYTEIRWVGNARSLLNFFELRSDETAMKEIREYSLAIEEIFEKYMPNVYSSFTNNGRIAP